MNYYELFIKERSCEGIVSYMLLICPLQLLRLLQELIELHPAEKWLHAP